MFKLSIAISAASLVVAQVPIADVTGYCTLLEQKCMSVHAINASTCADAFAGFPPGFVNDTNTNTIGCRLKFLDNAEYNGAESCRYAGPSGGGRCGPVLDAVCQVATTICNSVPGVSYATTDDCKLGLEPIEHQWGSRQGASAGTDNSLECRVYHALASRSLGLEHCSHFNFSSSPCSMRVPPSVARYCDTLQYNCQGANAQFATIEQCWATAMGYPNSTALDSGAIGSNGANSLGCREYHAQAARTDVSHCQHAGPTGGGVCGTRAEAWGSILAAAPCSDPHVASFVANTPIAKVNMMVPAGFNSTPYSTSFDTTQNTQACRIYHLGVASTDPSHCSHGYVSGGGLCGTIVPNLCTVIEGACGFGASAWQFATRAACETALSNSSIVRGTTKPQDSTGDSHECRFYHATVAASYAPGGMSAGATGNASEVQYHCGHTLKPATAGGCGYMAPAGGSTAPSTAPTTKAPSAVGTTTGSASMLSGAISAVVVFFSVISL